jgi:hypothetical protein
LKHEYDEPLSSIVDDDNINLKGKPDDSDGSKESNDATVVVSLVGMAVIFIVLGVGCLIKGCKSSTAPHIAPNTTDGGWSGAPPGATVAAAAPPPLPPSSHDSRPVYGGGQPSAPTAPAVRSPPFNSGYASAPPQPNSDFIGAEGPPSYFDLQTEKPGRQLSISKV